jgi:DNA-binding winged helix-turn-helix (wHTH) protein
VFDEASWTLTVAGQVAQIEGKPLELLHELLLRAGHVVAKDELIAAVWPDVAVVEGSLPTAILKVRRALEDGGGGQALIKTVPRIGYRLDCTVEMEVVSSRLGPDRDPPNASAQPTTGPGADAKPTRSGALAGRQAPRRFPAGGLMLALALCIGLGSWSTREWAKTAPPFTQRDAENAVRNLDVAKIDALLGKGWNPNAPFDKEGNGALNILLGMCEWNPAHDRNQMVLMARTLIDGGARLDSHNIWGDTAYSIAKAPRYCGPDHPVTQMLHTLCYAGYLPLGDRCLALRKPAG